MTILPRTFIEAHESRPGSFVFPGKHVMANLGSINTSKPSSGLAELPPELLDHVLQYLRKRDLKTIRLTVKSLYNASSRDLFESFTVYPHLKSFKRLTSIADSSQLAPLIRNLEYNTAFRCIPRIPFRFMVKARKALQLPVGAKLRERLISSLRKVHGDTLMGGNTSDELLQMDLFRRTIPRLSSLQSIIIREIPYDDVLPDFYTKMLPEDCVWTAQTKRQLEQEIINDPEPRQSHALALLAGAKQLPALKILEIHGLQWDDFMGQPDLFKRPILYRDALGRLERLCLLTTTDEDLWDVDVIVNLQDMLKLAVNLHDLAIWFKAGPCHKLGGEIVYDFDQDGHCQSIFQLDFEDDPVETSRPPEVKPRLCWSPNLQRLSLRGVTCTLKEFQKIMSYNSESLRSFHLSDLILLPERKRGPRACLVKMLKWLQSHLQLEAFAISGYLSNGGYQTWQLTGHRKSAEKETLYQQIVDFVLSPTNSDVICPFEYLEIQEGYLDLESRHYTRDVPERLRDPKYGGDESMMLVYHSDDEVPSTDEESDDEDDDSLSSFAVGSGATEEVSDDEWESASDLSVD